MQLNVHWKVLTPHGSDNLPCAIWILKSVCVPPNKAKHALKYDYKVGTVCGDLKHEVWKKRPMKSVASNRCNPLWWTDEMELAWVNKIFVSITNESQG